MRKSFVTLTTAILIFLMVFTFHPQVVFADDGTPTSDETTPVDETPPPEENVEATETNNDSEQIEVSDQSAEEYPPSTDETIVDETETPTAPEQETSTEQTEPAEETNTTTVSDILEQAPEGTQLVVLDDEGQAEPLASQEAAEIVSTGDPMWCPGTALPGDASCSSSYTSFEDLLVDLGAFTGDGTIYVANTYNSGLESDDITIDGNVFTNLGSLTIQGGWDGILGGANIIGTSTFSGVSLEIINWGSQVTVNDIILTNTPYGLTINTSGVVSLDNVQVTNTTSNNGIGIQAGGNVTLDNVVSSSSAENGVDISTTSGNINISNSTFNNNGGLDTLTNTAYGMGLNVETQANGNITVSNVTATGNAEGGAYFGAPGSVTLANSVFDNNTFFLSTVGGDVFGGSGLEVQSGTGINLNNISTSGNYLFGADLTAGTTLSITDSNFSNNDAFTSHSIAEGFGLDATAGGNVTLTNVIASGNYLFGADITSTAGAFDIQTGNFSSNQTDSGLYANSPGTLTLNNVIASSNGSTGAVLENGSDVSVSNSIFNNNAGPIYAAGIEITSPGSSTVSNVTANSNQDDGISISNSPEVYLNNITVDNNGWDGAYVDGLCTKVYITDGIFTNNGFVNPQGGYGLEVDNALITQSGAPVFSNNFLGAISQHLDPCFIVSRPPKGDKPVKVGVTATVVSGQLVALSCDVAVITLITPKDTRVTYTNFCDYQTLVFDETPDELNSRFPFLGSPYYSGVTVTLLLDNSETRALPATSEIVLSFRISDEELDQEFAIYHWDDNQWVELEGIRKVYDRVEVITKYVGTFVLVRK